MQKNKIRDRKIEHDERYAFAQGGGYKYENGTYHLDASGSFAQLSASDGIISHYTAELISATDYYAYGAPLPERSWQGGEYRFGFQGQVMDDEIYGQGNYLDYSYRGYNSRLGRFFAVDPLSSDYPFYSTYQFSGNRLIDMVEFEGLEPKASGSYRGVGAIAPKLDENENPIEDTENQRWVWNNNTWNAADVAVTQTELRALFPRGNYNLTKTLETTLNLEGASFGIHSLVEMNAFIAQTGFESRGFRSLTENLNFRLSVVREKFTRLDHYSDEYINYLRKHHRDFANVLYGGDCKGIDYRGRGLIQTTWIGNYREASKVYNSLYGTKYDFTQTPALLATDYLIAVRTSLIFFKSNGLFSRDVVDIDSFSKKINRADAGTFSDRKKLFNKVNKLIK